MKRKGFTLVELLIVIAILGTLSAMTTLSSTNATASAEAAKIVNGLRMARSATIMYYWDHPDLKGTAKAKWEDDIETKFGTEITDYLEATPEGDSTTNYSLKLLADAEADAPVASDATWYIGYELTATQNTTAVKNRLAGQATAYGLRTIAEEAVTTYAVDGDTAPTIYIVVRGTDLVNDGE